MKTLRVINEMGDETYGGEQEGDRNKSAGLETEAGS